MQTAQSVLAILAPVIALIATGWIAARYELVSAKVGDGLSDYVFSLAVPALIVLTLTKPAAFSEIVPGYWAAYFGGVAVVWALAMTLASRVFGRNRVEAVMLGFSAGQSNIVLLGVPLVLGSFGEAAAPAMFLLFAVHLPVMMTVATLLMDVEGKPIGAQAKQLGRTLGRNPIVQSLVVGLVLRLVGFDPTGAIGRYLGDIGGTASTCALIAMGMSLSRYRLAGHWRPSFAAVGLKLVLHPLVVWLLAFHVLQLPGILGRVATLFAALPTGINAYLMAVRYRAGEETISSVIVLSTVLSFVSISIWLVILLPA